MAFYRLTQLRLMKVHDLIHFESDIGRTIKKKKKKKKIEYKNSDMFGAIIE